MIPTPSKSAQDLTERIRFAARRGTLTLPPLPELAVRLLALLRDQDRAGMDDIGTLIEHDQALAASILRMANSSLFGGLRQVDTLAEASARLGLRQIATMVTTVTHRGHFQSNDPERLALLHVLWDHAVTVAVSAKHLTARGGGDRAEAFLAGLLHDVGKLLVLKGVDTFDARPGVPKTPLADIHQHMRTLHTELGHLVLQEWRLPETMCRIALRHHDARVAPDDLLLLRVQAADAMARKLGASLDPAPGLRLLEVPAMQRLGLPEVELGAMLVDVEDEVSQIKSAF